MYGSDGGDASPNPAFVELLETQGPQEPLAIDTSWLGVGHIDEFLSFTSADNNRGWTAVIADPALAALTAELGLGEEEIARVPAVFTELVVDGYPRQDIVANHLPAIVNGVETGTGTFLAIRPHGPLDADGRDVLATAAESSFDAVGSRIDWVEAWNYGHAVGMVGGEFHCLTNTIRDQSGTEPWWRD